MTTEPATSVAGLSFLRTIGYEKDSYILQARNVRSWALNYTLIEKDEKQMILPEIIDKIVVSRKCEISVELKAIIPRAKVNSF